ncbi:MAG TPA: hypothetical protein VFH56_05455 [Acidimicrobiales bacterium]|nr:hypothetical protein [Acidimicrobiales bacterium]
MQLQDRCDGYENMPHLADFEARNPVSDREIMGLGLWLVCKPIFWAIAMQGRYLDWRNRHLHEGD